MPFGFRITKLYRSCEVWPVFFEVKRKNTIILFHCSKISRIFYIVSQIAADAKKQITY